MRCSWFQLVSFLLSFLATPSSLYTHQVCPCTSSRSHAPTFLLPFSSLVVAPSWISVPSLSSFVPCHLFGAQMLSFAHDPCRCSRERRVRTKQLATSAGSLSTSPSRVIDPQDGQHLRSNLDSSYQAPSRRLSPPLLPLLLRAPPRSPLRRAPASLDLRIGFWDSRGWRYGPIGGGADGAGEVEESDGELRGEEEVHGDCAGLETSCEFSYCSIGIHICGSVSYRS